MKILGISGSLRKESYNTQLIKIASGTIAEADLTLADLNLPLYDGDIEQASGIPKNVQKIADMIEAADAVIISSPEYNQGISGVLKNALDWISRVDGNPWKDKPVALVHAAAGRTGGARANYALRLAMAPFGTYLIQTPEILVANAFAEIKDGKLENEKYMKAIIDMTSALRRAVHT